MSPEALKRQLAGKHKGLLHAVQKRKTDNSANYATNFDHGQTAFDFERSAQAAGESREEVREHLALLDSTLLMLCGFFGRMAAALPKLPLHSDATCPRAPKLVRALALLLWRPLRLFRTQEAWEWLALCYRLQQLVCWRQKHGELTVERFEAFRDHVEAIVQNYDSALDRRLKRIEKRFWKVWKLYRSLVGVVTAFFGGEGTNTSEICDHIANPPNASEISNPKSSIPEGGGAPAAADQPKPATACASGATVGYTPGTPLVQQRGTPHYDQFHPTWLERIDDLTPEAIANPFQSPSRSLMAQQKHSQPPAVKDPKDWRKHPPKLHLPEGESPHLPATDVIRNPSERVLRRLVRTGELTVPGSFEDFAALVEAALGPGFGGQRAETRDSGFGARGSGIKAGHSGPSGGDKVQFENQKSKIENPESLTQALAESLWSRMHVFSTKVAELRGLLEATLVWDAGRFLPLWLKMLPVEYGYDAVESFERTHGPEPADIAWGDEENPHPRRRAKPRPAIVPRSEAEGRRKHAGELQRALRIWFVAVWYVLLPVILSSQKVTVAFYEWAVSRFGIREEFLKWRPKLSLRQLETRRGRPEWAYRVVTVDGRTLVWLDEGQIIEPGK